MSGEDQATVSPQRKVRRGKGEANVEMECHCVSPSLARVTTRSHPAVVQLTISAAALHNDKVQ